MKIRIKGTKEEINKAINRIQFNYMPDGNPIFNIKSISKFYPNRFFGFKRSESQKEGRVYIEID